MYNQILIISMSHDYNSHKSKIRKEMKDIIEDFTEKFYRNRKEIQILKKINIKKMKKNEMICLQFKFKKRIVQYVS